MNIKRILIICLCIGLIACQEDDQQFGEIVAPSNLTIDTEIVGADADNPFGDGSGEVIFTADADNAISYEFKYSGNEQNAPSGRASYIFSNQDVNTYTVTAVAYGKGGVSTSETVDVEVLVTYDPPVELKTKLYNFDPENPDAVTSRTWRIKAEAPNHFGLGPVDGEIPTEWYGAGINEKAGVGMYDDRYIFDSEGNFTFITNANNDEGDTDPSGTVFGRAGLIDELGASGGEANGADIENLPFEDFQVTYSLIELSGKETISISGIGFIGYYTGGNHNYEIFDRSVPNELLLRTTDGNNEFDWWFILQAVDE